MGSNLGPVCPEGNTKDAGVRERRAEEREQERGAVALECGYTYCNPGQSFIITVFNRRATVPRSSGDPLRNAHFGKGPRGKEVEAIPHALASV